MKKLISFLFALTLILSASIASAEGPYVRGHAGYSILNDSDIYASEGGITTSYTIEYEGGYLLGAAVGYDFDMGRIEGEIGYQSHELDRVKDIFLTGFPPIDSAPISGDISALSFLLNGYFDIDTGSPVTPFISGGIGAANIDIQDLTVYGENIEWGDDTVFAYQLGAGLGIAVNETITIDVGYRYFGTSDADIDGADLEYSSHNIYGGIRVAIQ